MNKKTSKSLIIGGACIIILVIGIILLVTVVNKKTIAPIFQTDSTGKTLLVYNGKDKEVEIPKEITLIGNSAFENNSLVNKVTFEEGSKIESISRNAFKSCVNLSQIVFPNTLQQIDYGAFQDCMRLERVTIPSSVKKIGNIAFKGCSSLDEIRLNEGIETIGDGAFSETGIDYIHLPSSIKDLGEGVFTGCSQLETLNVAESSTLFTYDEVNKVLYMNKDQAKEIVIVLTTTASKFVVGDDVTKIHTNAFVSAESIEELIVPNSVKEIGLNAFIGCTELKSIKVPFIGTKIDGNTNFRSIFGTVPTTLTNIEISQGTMVIEKAFKDLENVTTITLPNTIKFIDTEAFSGCTKLSTINNIPTTLNKISKSSFAGCSSLTDAIITQLLSPTVEIIEDSAFANCLNIKNINIPNTVKHIASGAFRGCSGLKSLSIPFVGMGYEIDKATGMLKKDNNNENIFNNTTLFGFIFGSSNANNNSASVPAGLTQVTIAGNYDIPNNAFVGCSKLSVINLSTDVKKIGAYAFSGCSNLGDIVLPEKLEVLGEAAFLDCTKIKTIVMPNLVTTIEDRTFAGCTSLESINVAEVLTIGDKVFDKCSRLSDIIISPTNPNYTFVINEVENGNKKERTAVLYTKDLSELILYLATSNVETFTVPEEVRTIRSGAFVSCRHLESLIIPKTVTEIASQAIVSCTSLTHLSIPFVGNKEEAENPYFESIIGGERPETLSVEILKGAHIRNEAFINVTYLTSITFNSELQTIGDNAFVNCQYLSEIIFDTNSTNLVSIGKKAFSGCSGITALSLPSSIKYIGDYAFADCNRVTSISIPLAVETIGVGAFRNWSSLQNLNISADHPKYKLEDGALLSKDGEVLVLYVAGDSKESYTITSGVKTINPYAFSGANNLKEVIIPETIEELPEGLFYNCGNLQTVTLPTSNRVIPMRFFAQCKKLETINNTDNIEVIEDSAFLGCSKLTEVPLSSKITSIGESAFEGCSSLTKVTIPSNITHLPKSVFKDCSSLTEVIFPEGLKEIGESAFESCTSIVNFVLPSTLEVIGNAAFNMCNSTTFTKIIIPDSVKTIGDNAFNQCVRITYVYIPQTVETIGSTAFANLFSASILTNAITFTINSEGNKAYKLPETWAENFDLQCDKRVVADEFVNVDGLLITVETSTSEDGSTSNKYAKVVGYMGNKEDIVIPEKVTLSDVEYDVTHIAQQAFAHSSNLKTITIHKGIVNVGKDLFMGCTKLEKINCEMSTQPTEWESNWNLSNIDVTWNYKN